MSDTLATAWAVYPAGQRPTIEARGAQPDAEIDGDTLGLFSQIELALAWAADLASRVISTPLGAVDVWEVTLHGLPAEHFPHIVDGEDVHVKGGISPERMRLVKTI